MTRISWTTIPYSCSVLPLQQASLQSPWHHFMSTLFLHLRCDEVQRSPPGRPWRCEFGQDKMEFTGQAVPRCLHQLQARDRSAVVGILHIFLTAFC